MSENGPGTAQRSARAKLREPGPSSRKGIVEGLWHLAGRHSLEWNIRGNSDQKHSFSR
jgi:hypothetical protein